MNEQIILDYVFHKDGSFMGHVYVIFMTHSCAKGYSSVSSKLLIRQAIHLIQVFKDLAGSCMTHLPRTHAEFSIANNILQDSNDCTWLADYANWLLVL